MIWIMYLWNNELLYHIWGICKKYPLRDNNIFCANRWAKFSFKMCLFCKYPSQHDVYMLSYTIYHLDQWLIKYYFLFPTSLIFLFYSVYFYAMLFYVIILRFTFTLHTSIFQIWIISIERFLMLVLGCCSQQ